MVERLKGLELSKYSNNNRLFSFIARFLVTLLFIQIKIDLSMNTCMFEVTDRNVNGDVSASSSLPYAVCSEQTTRSPGFKLWTGKSVNR